MHPMQCDECGMQMESDSMQPMPCPMGCGGTMRPK